MIKNFAEPLDVEIPPELKQYVRLVIYGHFENDVSYPMFPSGFPMIIYTPVGLPEISVNGKVYVPQTNLNLAGQIFNAEIWMNYTGAFGGIGIILNPTAPYYLFNICGKEILNKWIPFPEGEREYFKELANTEDHSKQANVIFRFLQGLTSKRQAPIEWLDKILETILELQVNIDLSELTRSSGKSERHFRRIFKQVIGVPPKYYIKVIQLNTIFVLINNAAEEKLHHLALDCGYYDQAHFLHDFKKHIGTCPGKFLNSRYSFIQTYLASR
jgi:AraC-like DNA-binding protein